MRFDTLNGVFYLTKQSATPTPAGSVNSRLSLTSFYPLSGSPLLLLVLVALVALPAVSDYCKGGALYRGVKGAQTSLDYKIHNSPLPVKVPVPKSKGGQFSKKQKRTYGKILMGFKRATALNQRVRFMTLTSAPNTNFKDIGHAFQVLKQRITRKFSKMDYIKVTTSEGYGVIHVLYRGPYIPQSWLSNNWKDIWGSEIVDIRLIKEATGRMASYLAAQYVAGQDLYIRTSESWTWVYKRSTGIFKYILNTFGFKNGLKAWNDILSYSPYYFEIYMEAWKSKLKELDNSWWVKSCNHKPLDRMVVQNVLGGLK